MCPDFSDVKGLCYIDDILKPLEEEVAWVVEVFVQQIFTHSNVNLSYTGVKNRYPQLQPFASLIFKSTSASNATVLLGLYYLKMLRVLYPRHKFVEREGKQTDSIPFFSYFGIQVH